ncbi:carbohydrate-binding protein [Flammeovirga sp. EKP202]|uniref:carbohydrate-binding protein n=1 Tax=Flammeovirga sp. EKP202 TaxID=2770592 RepID=UPI00165FC9D6|nr:carbohydrate-binding protein [Flammeovirga sp. EKP202]MBD0403752.1 carbohydrate-binding protein [Flammeovirga sp. EKP202]
MIKHYFKQPVFIATLLVSSLISLLVNEVTAQTTATINHKVRRYIGGVSSLDRTKFFNLHSNWKDTELNQFYSDYNAFPSRGFWGPYSYSKSKGNAVGTYPADKSGNNNVKSVTRYVATEHPYNIFKDGLNATSAANWAAEYYKDYASDSERPEYFEPMNEPFVHASDYYSGPWNIAEENRIKLQMAEVFAAIGKKIHDTPALDNMKIIGYSAAWPSLEISDFAHWDENMKMFMDVAGADMDAFSTHLYDGVNVTGQNNQRSGSNSEAILDLIETYSHTKWGTVKPHAITEYGAIASGYGDNYSDVASIQTVRSINHMLFNLLDRENKIEISIPFITDKSLWHLTAANNYQPYSAALFIPTNLGQPNVAGWKYAPKIHFYELWKNVKGNRVHVATDNPDIQIQGFADGNKLYVALNNLDDANQTVNLDFASGLGGFQNVTKKSLKIYDTTAPVMNISTSSTAPGSITLIGGETVVFEYQFSSAITFDNTIRDRKYYTSKHLQAINANTTINFNFNTVQTGTGLASLQMGIGRKHNKSKNPTIKINGTTVTVPNNWKGYDQTDRSDFFGVIEIPFDISLLQASNTVSVTFPDGGGHISSMILEVKKYDQAVIGNESITINSPSTNVESDTKVNVTLAYTANSTRDIVAEFWSSTGWLGQAVKTVSAGNRTETLTINLNNAPATGSGYVVKASIRPVGTNWTSNIATDQVNGLNVIPAAVQNPYGGTPSYLPGKVESENYDTGGEGVAYHDSNTSNQGGQYRTDGVDVEACSDTGGGFNIGWINASEWLEYTVNVGITDNYDFFPRVASTSANGQFKILVDGVAVTGNLSVPNTGGWQTFQTMHIRNIALTAGQHVIRWETVSGGYNFNSWAAWQSSTSSSRTRQVVEEENDVVVYPNPVTDKKVYIKLPSPNESTTQVEIVDLQGRVVKTASFNGGLHAISVNDLTSGVYIVQITTQSAQFTKKIIIE